MEKTFEKISQASKNYADALISVVKDGKISFEKLSSDIDAVCEVFETSEDFRVAMESPAVDSDKKIEIINAIFAGELSSEVTNFLKILAEKKRICEFLQIRSAYVEKLNEINNIQPVTIVSAVELSGEKKSIIAEKLAQKTGKNVQPVWLIDESIIAGLKIEIDDNVADMSLKNRIVKLSKNLK